MLNDTYKRLVFLRLWWAWTRFRRLSCMPWKQDPHLPGILLCICCVTQNAIVTQRAPRCSSVTHWRGSAIVWRRRWGTTVTSAHVATLADFPTAIPATPASHNGTLWCRSCRRACIKSETSFGRFKKLASPQELAMVAFRTWRGSWPPSGIWLAVGWERRSLSWSARPSTSWGTVAMHHDFHVTLCCENRGVLFALILQPLSHGLRIIFDSHWTVPGPFLVVLL